MRTLPFVFVLSLALPAAANDAETARALTSLIPVLLENDARVEVMSSADVREMVALEGEKAALGCDVEATSCLAEVAGALGANYVIFGQLSRLGAQRLLTLNLFNSERGAAVSRTVVRADDAGGLADQLEAKVAKLLEGLTVKEGQKAKLLVLDVRPPEGSKDAPLEDPPPEVEPGGGMSVVSIGLLSAGGLALAGGAFTAFIAVTSEGDAANENVQLARKAKYDQADGMWIATAVLGSVGVAALVGGLVFMGGE